MRSSSDGSPGPSLPKSNPGDIYTPPSPAHHSAPTALFLRTERDMRLASSRTNGGSPIQMPQNHSHVSHEDSLGDSTYGVQSLEDTLADAFPRTSSESSLVTNNDTTSRPLVMPGAAHLGSDGSVLSPRKRKAGRPVHPKIAAAAQRIISSEHRPSRTSSISSWKSLRSVSATSCERSSATLIPSGIPSGMPSSPRTDSVRSLALTDEDCSVFDDSGSQAIHSSSEDEEVTEHDVLRDGTMTDVGAGLASTIPQLVMPSLRMPKRRPFTDRGGRMGQMKALIMGPSKSGKTCLLRSILQSCEDIVHIDPSSIHCQPDGSVTHTGQITEVKASTKPLPPWWSDVDASWEPKRRRSVGAAILDRNICFVDTPGWDNSGSRDDEHMQLVANDIFAYVEDSFDRNMSLSQLDDTELLTSLCGGGGFQVDLIIYVFRPTQSNITTAEVDLLSRLSQVSNIIPVIGKSDTSPIDLIHDARAALKSTFHSSGLKPFSFGPPGEKLRNMIYTISSAHKDDSEIMDASLLMSPDYSPPLWDSDLPDLVQQLFEPENMQQLRHYAVKKFLRWREEHAGYSLQAHKNELRALSLKHSSLSHCDHGSADSLQASAGSLMDTSFSGVLVPRATSPLFRPESRNSSKAFGSREDTGFSDNINACSQIHVAGWAADLQRALGAERRRLCRYNDYKQNAITRTQGKSKSPQRRGRMYLANAEAQPYPIEAMMDLEHQQTAMNVHDPLGILGLAEELSRRGWLALQVVGGGGVLVTAAVWMVKNWSTMSDFLGFQSAQLPGCSLAGTEVDEWRGIFLGGKW